MFSSVEVTEISISSVNYWNFIETEDDNLDDIVNKIITKYNTVQYSDTCTGIMYSNTVYI